MRLRQFSKIAEHLAQVAPTTKTILIDVFGGAGGNSIAFARSGRWKEVHVIERDAITLACARHNAKVYGVDDVITWYHGDCFEILKDHFTKAAETAVVFASPPWGGRFSLCFYARANQSQDQAIGLIRSLTCH